MISNVIFLGPPGSGKGTQSELLSNEFGMFRLSTGDLLREEVKKHSAIGNEVGDLIDHGHMAPDAAIAKLVQSQLTPDVLARGVLFDGFPRNLQQANLLTEISKEMGFSISRVFYFTIEIEELLARIHGRLVCSECKKIYHEQSQPPRLAGVCDSCGGALVKRHDDENEAYIRTRYDEYLTITAPLIEYYRDNLVKIDASKHRLEIFDAVRKVLID